MRNWLLASEAFSDFLAQYFQLTLVGRWLNANAVGQTMLNLNASIVSALPILTPTLIEQQKIADILSTWDQAIEATQALLDNAKRQKRALMQQLLTAKHRFPEFQGQEWKEVRLGDLGTFKKGKGLAKGSVGPEGKHPVVLYGQLYTTYGEVISDPLSRSDLDEGLVGKASDILIPAKGLA